MYPIPGHLAGSLTLRALTKLNCTILVLTAFIPDIIDKFLCDVLHWTSFGRMVMHNIPVLILIAVVLAAAFRDLKIGYAWAAGHFLHLLSDISFIPWWFPFRQYNWPEAPNVTKATLELRYLFTWPPQITPQVIKVYKIHLILMETLMLALAIALWMNWPQNKIARISTIGALLVVYGWRLAIAG